MNGRPNRSSLCFLLAIALGAVIFAIGIALGEALHDNPKPGVTTTRVSTVQP